MKKFMPLLFRALLFCALLASSLGAAFNTAWKPSLFSAFSSPAEEKIVRELGQKKSDTFSFLLDASLIASGIAPEGLDAYRQKYQGLSEKIRRDTPNIGLDAMGRAAKIFELMFKHGMSVYKSEQTTLLEILNGGNFNCVSATLLYNLLALERGYETRVVVMPGHVYSQVRVGGDWIDAESTSPAGFNPVRRRENTMPGRAFIEDQGANAKKSFIPTSQLVGLLYYNRGTLTHNQGEHSASASLLVRGLYIFPEHIESQENFLVIMIEWARRENEMGRTSLALNICGEAEKALGPRKELTLLRENVIFVSAENSAQKGDYAGAVAGIEKYIKEQKSKNPDHETALRGYLLKWAQQSQQQKKYDSMLDLIKRASAGGRDTQADSMSLYLITEAAKQIARDEGFKKGYAFYEKQYPKKNETAAVQQNRLHIYGLWINSCVESKDYEEAYTLNRALIESYPNNQEVRKNTAWIVQRWANDIAANSKEGEYLPNMIKLYSKYREPSIAEEMVSRVLRESNQLQRDKHFARAEENIKKLSALKLGADLAESIDDMYRLVMHNWGVYHAQRSEFTEAIEIGKRARKLFPNESELAANLVNFYYSAGLALLNQKQYALAARVADEGLREFPKNASLLKLRENIP